MYANDIFDTSVRNILDRKVTYILPKATHAGLLRNSLHSWRYFPTLSWNPPLTQRKPKCNNNQDKWNSEINLLPYNKWFDLILLVTSDGSVFIMITTIMLVLYMNTFNSFKCLVKIKTRFPVIKKISIL